MRLKFMAALPALLAVPAVLAQAPFVQPPADPAAFTVGDINIEGLQRISEGTVFNYLPVNIGDRIDARRAEEALRSLYATGFFRDVELRRDGGTLVIAVLERPSIESFTIDGNKDIKTEDLEKSLRNVGLARGKTFDAVDPRRGQALPDRPVLLARQVRREGRNQGRRAARQPRQDRGRHRRGQALQDPPDQRGRQRDLQRRGAGSTSSSCSTPNLLSWYRQDDRYSREELSGDLEKLRSYYLDRGYANFDVESTQVTIAPDSEDMFVTMNVKEGEVYRISDVKIAGNLVVPEEELRGLVQVRRGDIYSQRMLTATTELMALRLGADGYAFAKIDPVPQEDEATKEIAITFLVDPGNRAYVRRINFNNTSSINDDVLRREMRQMEGGYLSNAAVDRSKLRLQRLPYIEDVEVETTPVPGSADLVDVNFEIKEGLPGQFSGGIGYSESQSVLLNGSFVHSNFMGTGNRVAAEINAGQYAQVYSLSHTDPYTTIDGVSRTVQAVYRSATQFTSASSDFSTDTGTVSVDYGWPISEFQSVRAGLAISRSDLLTDPNGSPQEAVDWVRNNGDTYTETARFGVPPLSYEYYGTKFDTYSLTLGWGYDSRNRALFADRGSRHRFNMSYTLPGSDVEFYTLNYDYLQFVPLTKWFTLLFSADVGYGLRHRRHDVDPAIPALLRRRPGKRARLPGEPAGPEGLLRQPVRRQPAHGHADRDCCCRCRTSSATARASACSSTPATRSPPTAPLTSAATASRPSITSSHLIRSAIRPAWRCSGSRRSACSGSATPYRSMPPTRTASSTATRRKVSSFPSDRLSEVFRSMRIKTVSLALLALAATSLPAGAAQAQTKIGVVNIARLLQESPQAQAASAALESEFAARRRDLENQQKDLKAREDKLAKDGAVMAEAERRNAEKTLRDGQRELARKQNEFLEDLNVRRNEALGQLQRSVLQEVQAYAKSAGLDVVVADALYAEPLGRHHRPGAVGPAGAQGRGAGQALSRWRARDRHDGAARRAGRPVRLRTAGRSRRPDRARGDAAGRGARLDRLPRQSAVPPLPRHDARQRRRLRCGERRTPVRSRCS